MSEIKKARSGGFRNVHIYICEKTASTAKVDELDPDVFDPYGRPIFTFLIKVI